MKNFFKNKTAIGFILTLLGGVFWGFSGSCGQFLFTFHSVTSDWLVPIRMLFSGLILLLICAVKNKKKIFDVWHGKKNILTMAAFTLLGLVMCQYAYFRAIEFSNAGIATVLQYLSPAMILAFTCIKEKRIPKIFEIIAIILAIGGTFLIAAGGAENMSLSPKALFWGLAAAVFLVCYTLIPAPLLKISDTPTILGWGMLIGGICMMPIFKPWEISPEINLSLILALGGVIIFGTVIAYSFFLEGVHLIGASKASIISSIEPVSATVISALWLKTAFLPTDFIGFVMIISTIFIISLKAKK